MRNSNRIYKRITEEDNESNDEIYNVSKEIHRYNTQYGQGVFIFKIIYVQTKQNKFIIDKIMSKSSLNHTNSLVQKEDIVDSKSHEGQDMKSESKINNSSNLNNEEVL